MAENTTVGPRVLAEQKMSLRVLLGYTGSLEEIPISDIIAGKEASCRAVAAETRYSPTDSDTLTDAALCEPANSQSLGASNYDGRLGLYRYADEENRGVHSEQFDEVYQSLKKKGTPAVIVIRDLGKSWDAAWEVGDEIEAYRVTTDHPQKPQDRTGYQKVTIPTPVQAAALNAVVAEDPVDGGV